MEAQELLKAVLDAVPEPIFYKDDRGIYLGCNKAFSDYLGMAREKIIGSSVYDVAPKELADVYYQADQQLFKQGGSQTYEASVVYADGTRHDVIFHKAVFHRPDGSLGGLVGTMVDVTERKRAEETARYLRHFDPLTGLPNQILFVDRLNLELAHAHRLGQCFAVCCLDLDNFKKINAALGHSSGNELLQSVSSRLTACLREDDTVARMGGDSFNLLLPNIVSAETATGVVSKILENLRTPYEIAGREVFISASIGIALFPYDGQDGPSLLRHADTALQRAKEKGRDCHHFFDLEMNRRAEERMDLEVRLRRAVDEKQFVLHYQPQIDTVTGRPVGVEALIRWRQDDGSLLMPDRFIQLAEQTGLILPIGEWVLRTACLQARQWQVAGLEGVRMAVNISPRQFQHPNLFRIVEGVLAETGLSPHLLSLEVTESLVMQDVDRAIETLLLLKHLGVHLAIDDFGTGYSSLSYLRRFPIDLLKIDRSFIMEIPEIADDMAIVAAVIAMARNLSLKVLAEGVQTPAQQLFLQAQGCDELQGYLFSPPLDGQEARCWLDCPELR